MWHEIATREPKYFENHIASKVAICKQHRFSALEVGILEFFSYSSKFLLVCPHF